MESSLIIPLLCVIFLLPVLTFMTSIIKVSGFGKTSFGQVFIKFFDYNPADPPKLNPFPYVSAFGNSVFESLPDILLIGVGVLALLLQNFPLLMLLITMLEIMLIRFGIGMAVGYTDPAAAYGTEKIRTGIRTPIIETLIAKLGNANDLIFPNGSLFITGATIIYLVMSLFYNYDVFSELDSSRTSGGGDWTARPWIGLTLALTGMIGYIAYRLINTTDTWGPLTITMFISILTGILLVYQNTTLFGPESVNFLGVPYLDSLLSTGGPITVCAAAATAAPTS
jgi:hypothetical protein